MSGLQLLEDLGSAARGLGQAAAEKPVPLGWMSARCQEHPLSVA